MEGNTVAKIALQAATYAIDKPYDYQVPLEPVSYTHLSAICFSSSWCGVW